MARTRYRKAGDEVADFWRAFRTPAFYDAHTLTAPFETDPEVVAELLPPPLAPADRPRALATIGEVRRSNCVGAFYFAAIDIACRYEDMEGWFCLTMPVSTDTALVFGRELYGEPKKLAEFRFDWRSEDALHGEVTRYGITFLELSAILGERQEVERTSTMRRFHFKYFPEPTGAGFDGPVQLVLVEHHARASRFARGSATLTFRDSPHDPLFDLPVHSVAEATYSESEIRTTAKVLRTVPAQAFEEFAFAKWDDLLVWLEEPEPATS